MAHMISTYLCLEIRISYFIDNFLYPNVHMEFQVIIFDPKASNNVKNIYLQDDGISKKAKVSDKDDLTNSVSGMLAEIITK